MVRRALIGAWDLDLHRQLAPLRLLLEQNGFHGAGVRGDFRGGLCLVRDSSQVGLLDEGGSELIASRRAATRSKPKMAS